MVKHDPKTVGFFLARKFINEFNKRHNHLPNSNSCLTINLVTTWNKQCGIATYSAFFAEELRKKVKLFITIIPDKNALSPFFIILGYKVGRLNDLVHVQFEYGLFSNLKLGKKKLTAFAALLFYLGLTLGNRKVITTMHEPRKKIMSGGRGGVFYTQLLDQLIFTVSDLIIVHTNESKTLLNTVYGVNESKLIVIPHGSFEQPEVQSKDDCKLKLGLLGKTVITILGFVTQKKGHDLVIPLLPQIDSNVQLVVAGGPQNSEDSVYFEGLKKQTEQYRVSDRVTFTGFLKDLTCVLNATDIAILPYRNVTDSGVLHHLIAQRIPIIASDLEAFKEIYDEFGCLDLFNSEDPQDLLRKIQTLLLDQKLRDLLAIKCVDMWNETKWSQVTEKHLAVYREVLSGTLQNR
jgi:glycosyltransferase involved in cell wall biosynthesis